MATNNSGLNILELQKFSLFGKSPDGERFGSPTFKVSVAGASICSLTCFPNSASKVEKEMIPLSLHQTVLIPFLKEVTRAAEAKEFGEYIASRNQVIKRDGGEKRIDGALHVKVSETGISVGLQSPNKTFIMFAIRTLPGYKCETISDAAIGSEGKMDPELAYGVEWLKDLVFSISMSSLLVERNSVRVVGGDTVQAPGGRKPDY